MKYINNQKGVTLIEMLIYMGLLSILLVSMTDMFVAILNVKLESEAVSSVEQDGTYLLARLYYDVNRADSISTPVNPGDTTNSLVLIINGFANTYALSGGNLQLTNTSGTDNLNSSETTIPTVTFKKVGSVNKPTIKMNLTVNSVAIRNNENETKTYSTTIGVR